MAEAKKKSEQDTPKDRPSGRTGLEHVAGMDKRVFDAKQGKYVYVDDAPQTDKEG